MASYVNISRTEMVEFLGEQGFKEVQLENTREMVLGKIVAKNICLRVYTGIVGDISRDVGRDAIRVGVFFRRPDATIVKVAGSKRVHRVAGWRKNLADRLDRWREQMFPACHVCDMPSVERTNKKDKTKFLGCSQYPNCRATRPMTA